MGIMLLSTLTSLESFATFPYDMVAFEVCGPQLVTDHVRSMKEGNVFTSVCDSAHRGRIGYAL